MSTSLALALLFQAAQPAPATAAPPPQCNGAAYEQFDFWVGEWDVYPNGSDKLIAHSRIERLYNGCAIRENWMPLVGGAGGSLSHFDPDSGGWHQTWIGSSPGRVEFDGGAASDGKIILTGLWKHYNGLGQHAFTRMTYNKREDGSVRQYGETSSDHGLTWTNSFDFIYRKRMEPLPK